MSHFVVKMLCQALEPYMLWHQHQLGCKALLTFPSLLGITPGTACLPLSVWHYELEEPDVQQWAQSHFSSFSSLSVDSKHTVDSIATLSPKEIKWNGRHINSISSMSFQKHKPLIICFKIYSLSKTFDNSRWNRSLLLSTSTITFLKVF